MKNVIGFVTHESVKKAKELSKALVENKLVGCINLMEVSSLFSWKGEFCEESEVLMILKSSESRVEEIIRFVEKNHDYECPEIVFFDICDGNQEYLDWLNCCVGVDSDDL